jgi:hypothetical protein
MGAYIVIFDASTDRSTVIFRLSSDGARRFSSEDRDDLG